MATANLDNLTLKRGAHSSFQDGACLLEAASYLAGEPWSDHPKCVSRVLGAYGRTLNDRLGDEDRQKLVPLIPRLLGTADDGQDEARRWLAADWSIRVATPRWLDAAGLTEHAANLRALAPIVDEDTAWAARAAARAARDDAWIARNASRAKMREAISAEFAKRGLTAVAAAVAAADAVAVAAAAAVAAADADADADAAAAAVAAAFSYGSKGYWAVRTALEKVYREKLQEGVFAEVREVTNREAIELLEQMIDLSKAVS